MENYTGVICTFEGLEIVVPADNEQNKTLFAMLMFKENMGLENPKSFGVALATKDFCELMIAMKELLDVSKPKSTDI